MLLFFSGSVATWGLLSRVFPVRDPTRGFARDWTARGRQGVHKGKILHQGQLLTGKAENNLGKLFFKNLGRKKQLRAHAKVRVSFTWPNLKYIIQAMLLSGTSKQNLKCSQFYERILGTRIRPLSVMSVIWISIVQSTLKIYPRVFRDCRTIIPPTPLTHFKCEFTRPNRK